MPVNLACLSVPVNRFTKCADGRHALAFLGMVAPISDDALEAEAAALFSRLIKDSEWTHETLADKVGVSPGRVSQWATNRGAIPAERALAVAQALGTQPELISVSWRNLRNEFVQSQLGRLTPAIVAHAVRMVRKATGIVEGKSINVEDDLELFAQSLRLAIAQDIEASEKVKKDERRTGDGAVFRAAGAKSAAKAGKESKPASGGARQPAKRAAGSARAK